MSQLLQNTLVRCLIMVVCATLLLFSIVTAAAFVPSQQLVAHAATHAVEMPMGSNGQQIAVICNAGSMTDVIINGYNQNSQPVGYYWNGSPTHSVYVDNWWWKSNALVKGYVSGHWYSQSITVPTNQSGSDWVYVYVC